MTGLSGDNNSGYQSYVWVSIESGMRLTIGKRASAGVDRQPKLQ